MPIIHIRHASTEVGSPLAPHDPGYDYYDWAEPMDGEIEVIKQEEKRLRVRRKAVAAN